MPSNGAVKGNKRLTSGSSEFNAMEFLIRNTILGLVNTAIPVIVTAVDAGGAGAATGYVTVKPLVCQVDGFGETLDPAELFRVPYARVQGGIAALVVDPVPGDIGLAVFCKSDCSNVRQEQNTPVQPGSFRKFSMSDGFYIGGFLNKVPSVFIEVKQDQSIIITATAGVTVNAPTVTVPSGDVIASGVSLVHHVHGGVQPGGGNTGQPV